MLESLPQNSNLQDPDVQSALVQITTSARWRKDSLYVTLFLGPSLLLLSVFVFWPMIKTLYLSLFLTDNLGHASVFVGLSNYVNLFKDPAYLSSLGATLLYVIAVSVLTIVLGMLLAVAAQQHLQGIRFFRTIFSSTMGISVSVAAIFWLFAFNPSVGVFAQISQVLHLPEINWLADPHFALLAVIITTVWMNLGFTFLILFGALQQLPSSLFEAAKIAGVNKTTQFFKISLPLISPTLFFVLVVTLIDAFKSFGLIDLMTVGGPNNATNLLVYRVYQDAFLNGNYGLASTESVILTVIIAIITLLQFKLLGKRVNY
ncbi:glycerol-3-phosphate ABC transporter permease protein [Secundilactobacillus mixtipabuli]|uniref:Glycerol-3-phosphate ABC transporter permease protein n=1 Tax=Secundilactobacillus mixtipabuli TaxID=1435342 RepID=A0A1Z5IE45_9LACO|nr:glycerol-3-phosphate ABC transporter permease protein [Secundilactobacillus mixtipabuli]